VTAISDKKVMSHGENMEKFYEDARKIVRDNHLFVNHKLFKLFIHL